MSKAPDFYVIELFGAKGHIFTTSARTLTGLHEEIRRVRRREAVKAARRARITTWRREAVIQPGCLEGHPTSYSRWTKIERYTEQLT